MKKIFFILCFFSLSFGVDLPEYSELLYVRNFKNLRTEFQRSFMKSIDQKYSDYFFDYLFSLDSALYQDIESFSKALNSPIFNILKDEFYIVRTKDGTIFLIEFKDTKGSKLISDLLEIANAKAMKGDYYVAFFDNLIVVSKNKNLSYNFKKLPKKASKQFNEAFTYDSDIIYSKTGDNLFDKGIDSLLITTPEKTFFSGKEVPQMTFSLSLKTKKLTLFLSPNKRKINEYIDKEMANGFPTDLMIFFHLPLNPFTFFSSIASEEVLKSFEKDFKEGFYNQIAFGYRTKEEKGDFIISMKMKENFYKNAEYVMQNFVESFTTKDNTKNWVIKKYKNYRIFQNQKNEAVFYIREPFVYLSSNIKLVVDLINTLEGKKKTILDAFSVKDFKDLYANNIGAFIFNFESLGTEFFNSLKDYRQTYSQDVEEYSKWLKTLGYLSGRGVVEKDFDKYEFFIK